MIFFPFRKSFLHSYSTTCFHGLRILKTKMKTNKTNKNPKTQPELNYLLTQQGISSCKINH